MATRKATNNQQHAADAPTRAAQTQPKQEKVEPKSGRTAKPATVTVTFQVTVPEETARSKRSVYISGTFSQGSNKLTDWDTQGQKMKKVDQTHYTITQKIPEFAAIQYKYTLGDWESVELDDHCRDIPNRHITVQPGDTQTIEDRVQNWRGVGRCES